MIADLNLKLLSKLVGSIMSIIGLTMIPSLIVSIVYGESAMVLDFVKAIAIAIVLGRILHLPKATRTGIKEKDAFLIASLCWIVSSLVGALPFLLSGYVGTPIDAIFESTSGFTAVGASILPDIEALPKGLLFWRSFTVWLGGMGILIFAIAILPALGISSLQIAKAESPGPNLEKFTSKTADTAKILYLYYMIMTIVQALLLIFGGMSVFDAFTHAFATTGTGGFSNYNDGVSHFNSTYINVILVVFMFLGSLNFAWYVDIVRGHWRDVFRNSELRFYSLVILIFIVAAGSILYFTGTYDSASSAIGQATFQIVATTSTTGFSITNYDVWPTAVKVIMFALFFMGGCTSSTSGSLRALRVLVLLKYIKREFFLKLRPNAVVPIRINGKPLSDASISSMLFLAGTFIGIFLVGCAIISLDGHSLATTVSSVLGALSTFGAGFDGISPLHNFSIFSDRSKIVFIIFMIAARLEFLTLFVLFTPYFWISRHK